MGQFDHLFKTKEKETAQPAPPPPAQAEPPPATPITVEQQPVPWKNGALDIRDGKGNYFAMSAPKYERREWFFIYPRFQSKMHCPEMLRYDLLYRIAFSPDGSSFALIYVDQIYVLRGKNLSKAVEFIADRYLSMLQEFDPTLHRPLEADAPIITQIQVFPRKDINLPEWIENKHKDAPNIEPTDTV
jgi:hypothetical protein